MDAKLTLKLNKEVIEKAKEYASSNNRSLSRMIESYLKALVKTEKSESSDEIKISTFVKSMRTGVNVPADLDYKKEYRDHMIEKHK